MRALGTVSNEIAVPLSTVPGKVAKVLENDQSHVGGVFFGGNKNKDLQGWL